MARHFNLPKPLPPQHDNLRTILALQEHRKPPNSRRKIHLSTGYTLSYSWGQWTPFIPLIYSCHHISPYGKAPPHSHINLQHPTIPLFAFTKSLRPKRQLSNSFTVKIQPLSTRLIKPIFYFFKIFNLNRVGYWKSDVFLTCEKCYLHSSQLNSIARIKN